MNPSPGYQDGIKGRSCGGDCGGRINALQENAMSPGEDRNAQRSDPAAVTPDPTPRPPLAPATAAPGAKAYAGTVLVVAGCTALAGVMQRHFDPANLTMIYLLGVVVSAIAFGRGPAVLAAVLGVAVFDFLFVPPRFDFGVSDTQYLVTFAVMLVVAIVIGTLTASLREQRAWTLYREERAAALHSLARDLRLQAETERTRSALLSSVSHDLRTPLAVITGAATSLRDGSRTLSERTREELADTIAEEALRLNRLIGNLLDMTRLESGTLAPRREWNSLEEVVGAALARLGPALRGRPVRLSLPADLPLVRLDGVLFEQLVRNLVENANKYSPPGLPIELAAGIQGDEVRLDVGDHGPGFASGDEQRVFEKFYRGANAAGQPGAGLGLAICEAIARAHGGTVTAANRAGGGAMFTVWLPLDAASAPERPPEEELSQAAP
jgi:two-component system sensor histidine kinase KdpD